MHGHSLVHRFVCPWGPAPHMEARTGPLVAEKRRSSPFVLLSACLTLPLSWVLGRVAVLAVLQHDCLVGQQQQVCTGCDATPWWKWRSFVSVSSWAAVAAHPGDFGLVAAVLLPSLLAVLLVVGMVVQNKSDRQSMPLAVLRLAGDAGSAGAAALFLAVARLLPMACSMLVVLTHWVGLRQQYPASQALQLLHPATAVLLGSMTLISQASALHTLAVSMLHTALAGLLLLATDPGPSPPFYLTPAQAFAALLLFDVCIPAAVAWWWRLQPAQAAAARQAGTCTAAPPVQVEAAAAASDSAGTPFARPRSRGVQRAAEPASPGAALLVAPAPESSGPGPAKHSSTTAAPDPHLLQPCTPPGLSRDSSPSPNRQQSTSPPPSPAAAHPAWDDRAPLSFEDALAACARGVAARRAAGSTAPTMLYQSKLHHHVVGIKAPLDATLEGQALMQLVINHLHTASSALNPTSCPSTASPVDTSSAKRLAASDPCGRPLMLRPVAMRGCLHMLLPVCLAPSGPSAAAAAGDAGSSCVFDKPGEEPLQQLAASSPDSDTPAHACSAASNSSISSTQLYIQVDQGEPQLVSKRPDGSYDFGHSSNAGAIGSASFNGTGSTAAPAHIDSSSAAGSIGCWLEPSCVLQPSSAAPASGASSSTAGRVSVAVKGLPAAAGSLVRVLLVQGSSVVADQLLSATLAATQAEEGTAGARTVRLSLLVTGLAAGPAMVCVLSPPSSITAVASAPAGVSPAVAALLAQQVHHPTDSSSAAGCLQPARLWACLPLLVVSSTEAQQDLQKLFDGMCRELQQSADTCSSPGPSSSSTSSSSQAAQLVSVQHWQPFLWDWLYAAHGADASSMLGCIPQLAGAFRAPALDAVPLLGSTHEPAAVWAMDTSGSSSSSSMAAPTKQAILSTLLDLLVTHERWAAVQQLQAATAPAQAAPDSKQGSPLADSNSSSIQPLSGCRHNSCDSYNQIHASAGMPGWRPPVHCRDAAAPPLSLRKQALQEQQAKYIHTLEEDVTPAQHSCPAPHSRRQSLEGAEVQQAGDPASLQPAASNGSSSGCSPRGEGRQPAARRASASAAMAASASAGLFTPHRMSLDSLPLPHASAGADSELLRPPCWFVDLPLANDVSLQQHLQRQQQQQLFIPPLAMFGTGMLSTTSPPAAGALGAFGRPGRPAAGAPSLASPLLTHGGNAAAAAAAGAAAAQAALLHLNPGGFGSSTPGSSLPSPAAAMRQASGPHSGPGSTSRQYPHSVPPLNPALAHMHPQPSLGYSPSLASTASGGTSLFMTAADAAAAAAAAASGAMGSSVQGASPAGLDHRRAPQEAAPGSEDAAAVEGRHWAVFDTTGVEGFDQGVDTAATNLATNARRNTTTASSVTWLAIPTSKTHLGLPPTALPTPRAARKSGTLYSSSTGKLRRHPDYPHTVSSSLTPQPSRSQAAFFSHHHTAGGAESSAEYLATGGSHASGALSMPGHAAARRQGARTMLFSPAPPSGGTASSSQFQSFTGSPEGRSPVGPSTGTGARHMGVFSTPQRPGPATFVGASPRRGGGMWSPGHQLNTLPTIGSEDSWDQNAQLTPSPPRQGAAAAMGTTLRGLTQQQQQQGVVGDMPLQPQPRMGGLETAWAAASPGPTGSSRGPTATPRHMHAAHMGRPPLGAVAATPRGLVYRSQQGAATPGFSAGRAGAWVSGANLGGAGGGEEGDTVSGVLQLLGAGPEGGDSKLQAANSAAFSGFSSSDSSLAGTPDGSFGLQHGTYPAGYFTPVRPNRSAAAALLPASARPASRTVAWAAAPAVSGRNLPAGMSGSGFFAVGASGTGHAGAAAAAAAGQHQVPDTPLLKAGRSIAGSLFSPAPAVLMGARQQQQQQRIMSTPSHIQSLLPPPGSASKLKPAAALLASAAVTGGGMHPAGSSASLSTSAGPGQSSAAAAAALLQLSPSNPGGSSARPPTPQAPDAPPGPASGALTSCSSAFDMQPQFLQSGPLTEEDMHTPVQSPRTGTPTGSPSAAGAGSGSSALFSPAPPAAPARPVPAVVLVPALEAVESLYGSEEGFAGQEYVGDGYLSEGYAVGL